jgi:hypothetical protein
MRAERNNRRWAALLVIMVAFTVPTLIWWNWKTGRILVQSASSKAVNGPIIKIRDVPSSDNPLWILVAIHSRFYRCEYYRSQNAPLFSSQSFAEDSYIAQKVEVRWNGVADATILFDGRPTLRCRNGWWEKVITTSIP